MDPATHLEHVEAEGAGIAEAATDLTAPVPGCPDFDVAGLLVHTGRFCQWVVACLEANRFVKGSELDESGDDPVVRHRDSHEHLVSVLSRTDPDEERWTWGPAESAAFWFRRAAQELAVHRWDVESAVGRQRPLDPALAADGIDEIFEMLDPARSLAERFDAEGSAIHLHATDADAGSGQWLLRAGPERFEVSREHAEGEVAARAPASDLLLFLMGRVPLERLEVSGDIGLLERWQQRVRI